MDESYHLVPIGHVRSAVTEPGEGPRQGREAGTEVTVEVLPAYREALDGLAGGRQVVVVCWMHRARRDLLKVRPRGDASRPLTGVFTTRSPHRPNPLAVYTADLLEVSDTALRLRGVDAVDGTPVVDLRPHIHRLDD